MQLLRVTNSLYVVMHLFSNRSQTMSKRGNEQNRGTQGIAKFVTDVCTTFGHLVMFVLIFIFYFFTKCRYTDSVEDVFKLAKKEALARAVFFGFVSFLVVVFFNKWQFIQFDKRIFAFVRLHATLFCCVTDRAIR